MFIDITNIIWDIKLQDLKRGIVRVVKPANKIINTANSHMVGNMQIILIEE